MNRRVSDLHRAIDNLFSFGPATESLYTQLTLECLRANDALSAKRIQTHMEDHLYQPKNSFIHNRLLQIYSKSALLADACNLFEKMPRKDAFSWNAMLYLYAKTESGQELWDTFINMPFRNPVSFNTVISGLVKSCQGALALGAFVTMIMEGFNPDEHTHTSVLNACSLLKDVNLGRQVHGIIVTKNFSCSVFVGNALVNMYVKFGEYDNARKVLVKMAANNAAHWNVLIEGYLRNGELHKSVKLFDEMRRLGIEPNRFTLCRILDSYMKSGCVEVARQIFENMKQKDKVSWTTMIAGYADNGMHFDALKEFSNMMQRGVKPDGHTISSIVGAVARLAHLSLGRVIHGKSMAMGVDEDLLVSSALVDMYCKCGTTEDAWAVFTKIPSKNVVSWNSMIRGYAHNGKNNEALILFDQMLMDDCNPDHITFVAVLSACRAAGLAEKGKDFFDSMGAQHGVPPCVEHYACMVSLLGRCGKWNEAVTLIQGMAEEPSASIWSNLLSASVASEDVSGGEMAAKRLLGMRPEEGWVYVMMCNAYSGSGRWEDSARTRALLRAKRSAACSWLYVRSAMHAFQAGDGLHPHAKAIFDDLSKQMTDSILAPHHLDVWLS